MAIYFISFLINISHSCRFGKLAEMQGTQQYLLLRTTYLMGLTVKKMRADQSKWTDISTLFGKSKSTMLNYMTFYDFCHQYPRFLFVNSGYWTILNHSKQLSEYFDRNQTQRDIWATPPDYAVEFEDDSDEDEPDEDEPDDTICLPGCKCVNCVSESEGNDPEEEETKEDGVVANLTSVYESMGLQKDSKFSDENISVFKMG